MNTHSAQAADVQVVMRGNLSNELAAYARSKIVAVAERLADPVLHARIRLTRQPDPAVTRPVRVQVNLDVNGRLVRAQAAGIAGEDAVDLLVDRLRRRLIRRKQHWEARRGGRPDPAAHEWRHVMRGR
jgi:ribosome-associated translation inhibitor RaiA